MCTPRESCPTVMNQRKHREECQEEQYNKRTKQGVMGRVRILFPLPYFN